MPPHLLLKPTFIENFDKNDCNEKDKVRTDFVLQNIYSYSLRNKYEFNAVCAMNKEEEFVMRELEGTVYAFQTNYGGNVKSLCTELEITEDTIGTVILGVSNELFSDGITWSRIIALFVFVGELTLLCLSRKFPERIVDEIYECFCKLVKEKLKGWIDDHGGWVRMQQYFNSFIIFH